MLINDILENVANSGRLKTVVFDGNQEMFYGWFEYTSKKGVSYVFKVEFEYSSNQNKAKVHLILDGAKREFLSTVQSVVDAIETFYEAKFGNELSFEASKTFRKKDVLLEFLFLKK